RSTGSEDAAAVVDRAAAALDVDADSSSLDQPSGIGNAAAGDELDSVPGGADDRRLVCYRTGAALDVDPGNALDQPRRVADTAATEKIDAEARAGGAEERAGIRDRAGCA